MAIVPLKKITLYGLAQQRDAVLDGLQGLGCLHLVPLRDGDTAVGRLSTSAFAALKYLEACPDQQPPARHRNGFDFSKVDAEALDIQRQQRELSDEKDDLTAAITNLQPWGDFEMPPDGQVGGLRLWFYVLPHHERARLDTLACAWKIVQTDRQSFYVVLLSSEEPQLGNHQPVTLDSRRLSDLKQRLQAVKSQLEELHFRRTQLTRWCTLLRQDLDAAADRAQRQLAALRAHADDALFAVQGWVPVPALDDLCEFGRQFHLAWTISEPAEGESPPTLLKNPERVAGGEGAVTFYITPEYSTWDPTIVVFFSFSLFFGMIFSDAGYALLLAAAVLLLWRRLASSTDGRRFRNLLIALVISSAVYGILVGSYFGVSPSPGTMLGRLKVLDINDQAGMMALAVGIGGLHLMLANTITAWRYRRTSRCLGPLGWTAIIGGGLLLGSAMLWKEHAARLQQAGKMAGGAGALFVLLFSSSRPWATTNLRDWFGRMFDGFSALTGLSKVFGDVLSYLRLFALGLASAQLASTFNQLAGSAVEAVEGLGILLAGLILIVGHSINFLLAIMSGVVHGLRLNCIEFFNWSLTEEGHPFQAYCKKANR